MTSMRRGRLKRLVALAAAMVAGCEGCGRARPAPEVHVLAVDAGSTPEAAQVGDPRPPEQLPVAIRGTVSFDGALPRLPPLKKSADPACAGMPRAEEWVVATDGKLANVVVRVTEQIRSEAPRTHEPVVLSHTGCTYSPRVVALVDGQPLRIENRDGSLHNVRVLSGKQVVFNEPHAADAPPLRRSFTPGVYTFRCDVHPWAVAHAVVAAHPFVAVSDEEGAYEIRGLPPGDYTLETWHERYGPKSGRVTVSAGTPATVDFRFSEKDRTAR